LNKAAKKIQSDPGPCLRDTVGQGSDRYPYRPGSERCCSRNRSDRPGSDRCSSP